MPLITFCCDRGHFSNIVSKEVFELFTFNQKFLPSPSNVKILLEHFTDSFFGNRQVVLLDVIHIYPLSIVYF